MTICRNATHIGLFSLLAAFVSTLSVSAQIGFGGLSSVWNSIDAAHFILFLVLWILYSNAGNLKHEKYSSGLAIVFSLATFLGRGVTSSRSVSFLGLGLSNTIVAVTCIAGLFLLYRTLSDYALRQIDRLSNSKQTEEDLPFSIIKTALILLLLWLPWIIPHLPSMLSYDATAQVLMGEGMRPITAHHPPLLSMIYALTFNAGAFFGGAGMGAFSLLLLQLCALLFSFSYAVKCLIRWTANRRAVVGILLFWGLLPIVPLYISWIVKDTISAALFVLFTVYLGNVLHTRRLDGKALLQLTGGVFFSA